MQVVDIVDRLKEVIGKYTNDFSDIVDVSALSASGATITATTATPHGRITGNYVTIKGAKEPIAIASITRVGTIMTVITATDHKLTDPSLYNSSQLPLYVDLAGNTPAEYNGIFELLTVPNTNDITFTCKIATAPISPASAVGSLLKSDFDTYNGNKQITVLDVNNFTYTTSNTTLGTPAQGNIKSSQASRIAGAATAERVFDIYTSGDGQIQQNWMFPVVGSTVIYKDGTVASDLTGALNRNESFYYDGQKDFSIYVIIPSKNDVTGANASDTARSYEVAILKAIANFQFPSPLTDATYQPTVYVGNESDDYIKAYYVQRYDFLAKGLIQRKDTADFDQGVPLELIDGSIRDKGMTYKPVMR